MKSNGWFPTMFDDFFNTDFMPRANSTAPAVNVKESEKAYTMELAAPGIKKEYCRVSINDEGRSTSGRLQGKNLTIAIEKGGTPRPSESRGGYKAEKKDHDEWDGDWGDWGGGW